MRSELVSPTPWRVEKNLYGTANIIETDGRQIAACAPECPSADLDADAKQDEANAAYIVECVNAHERLVEEVARLRDALVYISSRAEVGKHFDPPAELDAVVDAARAALGEEASDGNA